MSGRLFPVLVRIGVLSLALGAAGCDSLNPFKEKEVPLPGARSPVFPPGHPNAGPQRSEIPNTHAPMTGAPMTGAPSPTPVQ